MVWLDAEGVIVSDIGDKFKAAYTQLKAKEMPLIPDDECTTCDGSGEVDCHEYNDCEGEDCPHCEGTGLIDCPECA